MNRKKIAISALVSALITVLAIGIGVSIILWQNANASYREVAKSVETIKANDDVDLGLTQYTHRVKVNLNKNGGTGGWDYFYVVVDLERDDGSATYDPITKKSYRNYYVDHFEDPTGAVITNGIIEVPTKEGYTLKGIIKNSSMGNNYWFNCTGGFMNWYNYFDTSTGEIKVDNGPILYNVDESKIGNEDGERTFDLEWEQTSTVTITVDNQGGTGDVSKFTKEVNVDKIYAVSADSSTATEISNGINIPEKEGYKFSGYYSKENGKGKQWVNEKGECLFSSTDDAFYTRTIYANWVPENAYSIKYFMDNTALMTTQIKLIGEVAVIADPETTYKNYYMETWNYTQEQVEAMCSHITFGDWTTVGENQTSIAAGTSYATDADLILMLSYTINFQPYTIMYNCNGAENTIAPTACYSDNLRFDISEEKPTREGYYFMGWEFDNVLFQPGETVSYNTFMENTTIELVAKWVTEEEISEWQHNVVYKYEQSDLDKFASLGRQIENKPENFIKGYEDVTLGNPKVEGYEFSYWETRNIDKGTGDAFSGSVTFQGGEAYTHKQKGGTVTLTANWRQLNHDVCFDLNSGEWEYGDNYSITKYGSQNSITIPQVEPTRNGYEFLYWKVTIKGEEVIFNPGDEYTYNFDNKDITLKAQWNPLAGQITIVASDIKNYEIYYKTENGTKKFYANEERTYEISNLKDLDANILLSGDTEIKFSGFYNDEGTQIANENGVLITNAMYNRSTFYAYPKYIRVKGTINIVYFREQVDEDTSKNIFQPIYYLSEDGNNYKYYLDEEMTKEMTPTSNQLTIPEREGYIYKGCKTPTYGDAGRYFYIINEEGYITEEIKDLMPYLVVSTENYESSWEKEATEPENPDEDKTIYTITLDPNDGKTTITELYYVSGDIQKIYTNRDLTNEFSIGDEITNVIPSRPGFKFLGYNYTYSGTENKIIDENGVLTENRKMFEAIGAQNVTITAIWEEETINPGDGEDDGEIRYIKTEKTKSSKERPTVIISSEAEDKTIAKVEVEGTEIKANDEGKYIFEPTENGTYTIKITYNDGTEEEYEYEETRILEIEIKQDKDSEGKYFVKIASQDEDKTITKVEVEGTEIKANENGEYLFIPSTNGEFSLKLTYTVDGEEYIIEETYEENRLEDKQQITPEEEKKDQSEDEGKTPGEGDDTTADEELPKTGNAIGITLAILASVIVAMVSWLKITGKRIRIIIKD